MELRVVGILFLSVGLWLLWFGGSQALRAPRREGSAQGTVTALRETRSRSEIGNSRRVLVTYAPVVRFSSGSGEPVEFVSGHGSSPPRFAVGESVPVAFDPANPAEAEISDIPATGFILPVELGLGLVSFLLGLVALYGARKGLR
jgi:hypothetical protein